MTQPSATPHTRSKEIRLGLVMYGGVSLAIYINGVTREFFELTRNKPAEAQKTVYDLLKDLIDADVVIDILSGTSAGGINAILLAYALTNGKDFHSTADFWRRYGDIEDLLRRPEDQTEDDHFRSILDGDVYLKRLEEAFRKMPPANKNPAGDPDTPRHSELDLFVTGTNVAGRIYTKFDEQGSAIDIKDHRTVFQLKHRPDRKEPFKPIAKQEENCYQSLGKLARLTSSFPVAFGAVPVNTGPKASAVDARLTQWGQLAKAEPPNQATHGTTLHFMDGGLLDNKPFTPTIREIFHRTADKPVERYLLYVEPDPERFSQNSIDIPPPSLLQAALNGGYSIRTYESIADDLGLLDQHNARVSQRAELARHICKAATQPCCGSPSAPILPNPTVVGEQQYQLSTTARLATLRNRALEGILRDQGCDRYIHNSLQRQAVATLTIAFDKWPGNGEDTLRDFDVYFRQRRLHHLVYRIHDQLSTMPPPTSGEYKSLRTLWRNLNRHLKYLEIVQFAMETAVDQLPIINWAVQEPTDPLPDARDVWITTQWAFSKLLVCSEQDIRARAIREKPYAPDSATLGKVLKCFNKRQQAIADNFYSCPDAPDPQQQKKHSVLVWSDEALQEQFAALKNSYNTIYQSLYKEFHNFACLDAFLYPLEYVAGRPERDHIKLVRLSPLDAQGGCNDFSQYRQERDRKWADARIDRLAGRTLAHFGGFLKQSWRANDILWGRLDAASKLIELLLTKEHLRINSSATDQIASYFPTACTVFPDECQRLNGWLRNPASHNLDEIQKTLTTLAHYEILHNEAGPMFESAMDQQFKWQTGELRVKPQSPSALTDALVWKQRRAIPADPILADASTHLATKQFIADIQAQPATDHALQGTMLGRWFTKAWRAIAAETDHPFQKLPPIILANLIIQLAVVMRNCLLREFPDTVQITVKSQAWYRMLLGFPLNAALTIVRSWRPEPIVLVVMRTIGFWVPLTLLGAQFYLGKSLGQNNEHMMMSDLLLWWGLPIGVLWLSVGHRGRLAIGVVLALAAGWLVYHHNEDVNNLMTQPLTAPKVLAIGAGSVLFSSLVVQGLKIFWYTLKKYCAQLWHRLRQCISPTIK